MANIKKSILLPLYLCSIAFLSLREYQPVAAQQPSCQDTVNSVLRDIRNRGTTVRYEIRRDDYQEYLISKLGNTSRTDSIIIALNTNMNLGRVNGVAQNILNSEVLMKNFSNQIFSRCGGTGIVNFGEDHTGIDTKFGMRDDGVLGIEICKSSSSDLMRPVSRIDYDDYYGGYCAFVVPDF